jgi:hypothetical protein
MAECSSEIKKAALVAIELVKVAPAGDVTIQKSHARSAL